MTENPYRAPLAPPEEPDASRRGELRETLIATARAVFWFGVFFALGGLFITFYPGSAAGWYLIATFLIAAGMIVPERRYRISATLLSLLCLAFAGASVFEGIAYEDWLRNR